MTTLTGSNSHSRSNSPALVFLLITCLHAGLANAAPKSSALHLQGGLSKPYEAPEFAGIAAWLNSPPLSMKSLRGKVVLVDFWTYSCINCVRTLPHILAWDRRYRKDGLVIIGVHSPEFNFEKNRENVEAALKRYGITYPVAMDNDLATWNNFNNQFWPAHYLIDRQGKVVYTHFGEGEYARTENNIRYLLGLKGTVKNRPSDTQAYAAGQTPETYLGYERAHEYGGTVAPVLDAVSAYAFPADLPKNSWALSGKWKIAAEKTVSAGDRAALRLNFKARKVFLVMGTADGKPRRVQVRLDGRPAGTSTDGGASSGWLTVDRNTLYQLVGQKTFKRAVLEIVADKPGLEVYAFTFGN
jgi:thiol-disulfide isomerase/thioredoxin